MKIEILHIEGCPSWVGAARLLREALDETGFSDTTISFTLLRSAEDAARVPFAGSPTIIVDGEDLFPGSGRTVDLACRVYPTATGMAGSPTTAQLIEAINARGQ